MAHAAWDSDAGCRKKRRYGINTPITVITTEKIADYCFNPTNGMVYIDWFERSLGHQVEVRQI